MIIHSLVLISQLFFYPLVNCDSGFAMDFGFHRCEWGLLLTNNLQTVQWEKERE
jgi:hypothetical protein